jgi:hypothetical protein
MSMRVLAGDVKFMVVVSMFDRTHTQAAAGEFFDKVNH